MQFDKKDDASGDMAPNKMNRIFYVHVPKAGGTSIWDKLSGSCGPDQSQICAQDSLTDTRTKVIKGHQLSKRASTLFAV